MTTYNRLPVSFTHGEGVWLTDTAGQRYLDAISGIGVNALGHAHPAVTEAICQQAGQLLHTSNLYGVELQSELANKLTEIAQMDRCFFANSGAEANEAAIKIARLHGHNQGIESPIIITFDRSFHGRTLATLTATGNTNIKRGFGPLPQGFLQLPYNDIDAVKRLGDKKTVVAVLVEPVQGEGGIQLGEHGFLSQLRTLCDEHNWLLMMDEVQSGNGRTGAYFAYQHFNWLPDVVTTAKGLANGVPIGACLAKGKAAHLFQPGHHGSTYGGNPLACAAALATIKTIYQDDLINNAKKTGIYILNQLIQALEDNPNVKEVRGCGLMIGIEMIKPCPMIPSLGLSQQLLVNVTYGNIIRLLPPLILTQLDADVLIEKLLQVIDLAVNEETP